MGSKYQEFCFGHDEFVLLDILVETSGRLYVRLLAESYDGQKEE